MEWYERYVTRWEDYRLPSGREEREELAAMIGGDGRTLLTLVRASLLALFLVDEAFDFADRILIHGSTLLRENNVE